MRGNGCKGKARAPENVLRGGGRVTAVQARHRARRRMREVPQEGVRKVEKE
jgi:hypothetical protein